MNYKNSILIFLGKLKNEFVKFSFSFFSKRNRKVFVFIFTKKWKMNFERRVAKVFFNFQQKLMKNENELKFSFFIFKYSEKWIGTRVRAFKWTKIFVFHFQSLRKMNWHSGTRIATLPLRFQSSRQLYLDAFTCCLLGYYNVPCV